MKKTHFRNIVRAVPTILPLITGAGFAAAQEPPGVMIELSSAEAKDDGCLLNFLIENSNPDDISSAVYEVVLFGEEGEVSLLTLLDFAELPTGRPRVRQFQFNDRQCDQIGGILINGAATCEINGNSTDACMDGLRLKSRLETEMIG
ncbi:hypothetical protein [Roseibium sp. RKSG952]|uniref:hypothetical protein n=1 Tax=Roseibium sp. RKSG952 TaxID=2529384 RepID=UPI001AD94411|nr:hypothetical protein [Roseibium sp. RKSG952]